MNRMFELEEANLQETFSTPSHVADDEFASSIRHILSGVGKHMLGVEKKLSAFILDLRQRIVVAASKGHFALLTVLGATKNKCDDFNSPRRALEDLYAKHFVFRPIKLADFQTDEISVLQDFANEHVNEVKRQFSGLKRFVNDKTELITLLNRQVPTFLDDEMRLFQNLLDAKKKQISTVNLNIFAMQLFQFYREVQLVRLPQQPLNGDQPHNLLEKYFETAITVLEKKASKKLPFKLLGSHQMSDLITVIKKNKAKRTAQQVAQGAYHTIYDQIIFAVSPNSV